MKVGELFITLGMDGAAYVAKQLDGVKGELVEVAKVATYVTGGLTAALYAFRKLAEESEDTGASLKKFENLTGLSGDKLQRWQQLAVNSNSSAEEMAKTISGLQATMAKMVLSQGLPAGIEALGNKLRSMGREFDYKKFRDTFYVMDKLREYARATKETPDIANNILGSFIPSTDVIQALRTSNFDLAKADPSRIYSDKSIDTLAKRGAAWSELLDRTQHSIGRMNIKYGGGVLKDTDALTASVLNLADAFLQLNEQLKIFNTISQGFNVLANIISDEATGIKLAAKALREGKSHPGLKEVIKSALTSSPPVTPTSAIEQYNNLEALKAALQKGETSVQIQTTVNVQDTGSAASIGAEIGAHISRIVNDSMRQLPNEGH